MSKQTGLSPFAWLVCGFVGYFFSFGVFVPYLPAWLSAHNYSVELISSVLAAAYIARFLGSVLFSQWSKPDNLILLLRLVALGSIGLVVMLALKPDQIGLLVPLLLLLNAIFGSGIPLTDSLASTWQQQVNFNYGRARLSGSLAFMSASLSGGYILQAWGDRNMMWWLAICLCLFLGSTLFKARLKPQAVIGASAVAANRGGSYQALLSRRHILFLVIALSLIQGAHASYYAYSVMYWTANGIDISLTGWLWGVSVAAEVLVFFFAEKLFKNISLHSLLLFTTLVSIVRWLLTGAITDFALLLPIQALHGITFALCHFATVRFISGQPSGDIAKLQALYAGVACCLSVALFMWLAGFAYQHNPAWAFYLMALLVVPALFLLPKEQPIRIRSV
ncbi:3-phenylpropionate MFS transporter [Testudinibacter sp. P80/BLE/0925]|uniref:3-phenylpropionate MFS transporter n=1 Tax=Testudinibacter sp. TW-1 TaxID=3417757 RepID=UPI003D36759C